MNPYDLVRRALARAQDGAGFTRPVVIGTIVVVLVAATCIRLGLWQLDRLEQKRARNHVAAARMAEAPTDVDRLRADDGDAAWRRIRLTGSCEGGTIVLAARSRHGSPGVHLLCRFRTAGGRVLLLDRGWLPSADARSVEPEQLAAAPRDTTLEAFAIPFPEGAARPASAAVIYRLNRAQAVAATGVELPGWYAQATGPNDVLPVPADPPTLDEGPHLGYAVQWFSFAAIGLIGWIVLVARRGPPRRGTTRTD